VDQILVGIIASAATLGTYAVAVNASEVLFYAPQAVGAALLPAVARRESPIDTQRTLAVFRSLLVLSLGLVAVAAALGPVLLPLVFGHRYQSSVAPFLWLLPSVVGYAAVVVFSNALVALSLPGLSSLGPVVALGLEIVLDLVLIGPLGATGAAIASSAALAAGGVAALAAYHRHRPFPVLGLAPGSADFVRLRHATARVLGNRLP